MNLIGVDQIAEAVGGRIIGPGSLAQQTIARVCTDSRSVARCDMFVALSGARFDGHDFAAAAIAGGATVALVSKRLELPPVASTRPAGLILVRDTLAALGRLAAWYRKRLPATIVGVTGSNGKTTTKSMIEHMLAGDRNVIASPKSFNNAIGVPLTLLAADSSHDVVVCEIGTNAPGEIDALGAIAKPDVAVIVSVSETHLEKLRSLEGIAAEKSSLLGHIATGGIGIVNCDRPVLMAAVKNYSVNLIRFGHDSQADLVIGPVAQSGSGISFTVNGADRVTLPVLGAHNAVNAVAAIAVGRRMGLSVAEAAGRLASFAGPPMRLQRVRIGRIDFINDAYNANPASMSAALAVLAEHDSPHHRKVFICGDMLELGPNSELFHRQLGQRVADSKVGRLIAVGRFASAVADGARQGGLAESAVTIFDSTDALLERVASLLAPGELVLLKGSRGMGLERVLDEVASLQSSGESGFARTVQTSSQRHAVE